MFRKRVPERAAGWVADYCPVCRDVQPMQLVHVGNESAREAARQAGQTLSHVACAECGFKAQTDPANYLAIRAQKDESIAELMKKTQPRLPLRAAGRVQWERRAIGGELAPPERAEAIREPFLILSYLQKQRQPQEVSPLIVPFILIAFTVGMVTLIPLLMFLMNDDLGALVGTALAGVLTGVGAVILNGRILRRKMAGSFTDEIEPRLARSLRPLRPTPEELEEVDAWMKAAMHPMAPFLVVDRLYDRIKSTPDRSLSNADAMDLITQARAMYKEVSQEPGSDDAEHSVN
jgi:hypothetical protein